MENSVTFQKIKAEYKSARVEQRNLIRKALKNAGFTVKAGGTAGQGRSVYSSGGSLNPPYDLSSWLWVDAERDGIKVFISLQPRDKDPNSGNWHVLMDRIGIEIGDTFGSRHLQEITKLELPLEEADLIYLCELIENAIKTLKQLPS